MRGGCEGAGVSGAETSNQWLLLGGRRVSRVSMPRLGGALRLGVHVQLLKTGRERGREGENIRTEIGLLARVQGVAGEIRDVYVEAGLEAGEGSGEGGVCDGRGAVVSVEDLQALGGVQGRQGDAQLGRDVGERVVVRGGNE